MGLFDRKRKDIENKLREYYEYLRMGGAPVDIQGKLTKKTGEWKKGGFQINAGLRIFIMLLLVFQAFYPVKIIEATWMIGAVLAIILFVFIIVVVVFPAALGVAGTQVAQLIITVVLILAIMLSAQIFNCGKSSCLDLLSIKLGSTIALSIFIGMFILGGLIGYALKNTVAFIFGAIIFGTILFFIIPYISDPSAYYQICQNIPFIVGTQLCKARDVYVEPLKTVKLPVGGGISLKFGTEETSWQPAATLYAGEPYEFEFTMTNYYEEPISFRLTPSIVSSYGSKIEFVQPFNSEQIKGLPTTIKQNQKITSLKPKESYQDSVLMDPTQMYVNQISGCPYTTLQINKTQDIGIKNITCAYDKPCEDKKMACVKVGNFECECADWTKATCSKDSVKVKMTVDHTGFFRGNASLYYDPTYAAPKPGFELTQGPLSVIIEFQPNPYVAAIHQYRQDVSMYVTFKNTGGNMTIKNFKVTPMNTVVHTIDNEKKMELIEEVGTQVISCRNIQEILPGGNLPSGGEVSGKLCTLTPPSVKTTLKDLSSNQVVEVNGVNYDRIDYYCNKVSSGTASSSWDKIYQAVKTSGVCEMLGSKKTEQKQTIESSMAYTMVIVEFSYDRTATFLSKDVIPYTRTEECINLEESTK